MNLLNKLTIKNLKLNKKRTIVTIIGIMLSVALITAVASIYVSGIASLIKFETIEKGNFHVAFYNVPKSDLEIFKNNREIEDLYLTQNVGYAKLEDSKNKDKPYAFIKSFTKDSLENLSVKLVEGRLPENETEIVIPTHLKTNGRVNLKVGDSVTLNVGTRVDGKGYELNQSNPYHIIENTAKTDEQIIDTTSITYKIVGIIERPATNIEEYYAPGYTFITYMDENNLLDKIDIYAKYTESGIKNNLKVTANLLNVDEELYKKISMAKSNSLTDEQIKEFDKLTSEINKNKKYDYNENSYLITLQTNPLSSSGAGELGIVAVIVCGIIVFTSVFCIKNSFDISITEKIKQYGMLRSIGATKKQIKRNVFYEATILGLIGIPLGILVGLTASYILIIISNHLLIYNLTEGLQLQFSFSLIAIIASIVLGVITIYLSAIRSARKAAKISPIDSIRNSANIKIKAKKVKSSKIIKKLLGIGGDISYKNLKRNKKKYRTTVISIVVSVFVFIALYSFMNLAFVSVENELNMSDYNISLSLYALSNYDEGIDNEIEQVTKLDGIKDYTIRRNAYFYYKNPKYSNEYKKVTNSYNHSSKSIMVSAVGNEQYKKYVKNLGLNYDEIKDKGILIDDIILEQIYNANNDTVQNYQVNEFDYKKGDIIEGKFGDDDEIKIEIGYHTDKVPFGFRNEKYNSMIIVSDEFFDKCTNNDSMLILYDSSDASKLQDQIDKIFEESNYSDYYIDNIEENARLMNNLFTLVGIFLYGFIIVISLIGITNIFNTITTNMELRKQEFAMLKSIGMTKKEFKRMIRLESIFMGVKSLLFGIPIGIGLSYLIYHFLDEENGLKYILPINAIVIAIIAVFLLISCIMRYSLNKINKQNTIETIRNENI